MEGNEENTDLMAVLAGKAEEAGLELGGDELEEESEVAETEDEAEDESEEESDEEEEEEIEQPEPGTIEEVITALPEKSRAMVTEQLVAPAVGYLQIMQLAETPEGRAQLRADLDRRDQEAGTAAKASELDFSGLDEADAALAKAVAGPLMAEIARLTAEVKGVTNRVNQVNQKDQAREAALQVAPKIIKDFKRDRAVDLKQTDVVRYIMENPNLKPEDAVLLALAKKPKAEKPKATPMIKDAGGTGQAKVDLSKMTLLEQMQYKLKEAQRQAAS